MDNTKETYNNIIKAVLFFTGLIIISTLLTVFIYKDNKKNIYDTIAVNNKINEIKNEPNDSLQVIFYGDSECYSTFYPKILSSEFNISSFVCATAAQHICDTYAILNENIRTQAPKVIVLETNCIFRKPKNTGTDKDIAMNFLSNHLSMFAHHSDWKILAKKALPKKRFKHKKNNKGFVIRKNTIPYRGGAYMKITKKTKKIPKKNLEYLNQIKSLCDNNNIKLILVSTPSPKNWSYKKHNGIYKWAAANSVTYIDLNLEKSLTINWKKDTKDGGDHLNFSGAKKVTRHIGEYLKKYILLKE